MNAAVKAVRIASAQAVEALPSQGKFAIRETAAREAHSYVPCQLMYMRGSLDAVELQSICDMLADAFFAALDSSVGR